MSSKRYRPWNPNQMVLFPHAMRDALEEGHIVFRILDVVDALDISCVTDRMEEKDPPGTRPYHPRMMLALLMYAYCCGVYSSRKIAAATYDIIPFRVLTGDQHPHFTVINEFRLRHLAPMMDRVMHNTGDSPKRLTADSGYMSEDNVVYCETQGIDAYIAVGRKKHEPDPPGQKNDAQIFRNNEAWHAMRDKLKTEEGREVYRHRKHIVEPVFGHVKEARRFRRFSLRGITKVRGEWTLASLVHNLLKLVNSPLHSCQQAPRLA